MYIPKRYGVSRTERCPFCGKQSVTKNEQGVPVCKEHKLGKLGELKCACGSWLDIMSGKYGAYFNCINCGNINFSKAMEMNPNTKPVIKSTRKRKVKRSRRRYQSKSASKFRKNSLAGEIVVTSTDLDFLY